MDPESTSTVSLWDDGERASHHSFVSELQLTLPENMDQANLTQENDNSSFESMSKVFHNEVILRTVFANFDFQTQKACREVCFLWKSIIDPNFKKRATVVCKGKGEDSDMNILLPVEYPDEQLPFTSFALNGDWKAATLTEFLVNKGHILTGLHLRKVYVTGNLHENIFVLPNLPKLKTLKISVGDQYNSRVTTPFSVTWNFLHSVDRLYLKGCVLNVEEGCRLSPTELTLKTLALYINQQHIEITENTPVFLDKLVDFGRLRALTMLRNDITVDLKVPSTSLRTVKFGIFAKTINWERSQWNLEFMQLKGVKIQRNQMSIKNLEIWSTMRSFIDLAHLPNTLESLLLGNFPIICNQPFQLPLLKHLILFERLDLNCLDYFRNFANLSKLSIAAHSHGTAKLNLEHIPTNLTQLTLEDYTELNGTGAARTLQSIVMYHMYRDEFNKWDFSKLNADDLIYSKVGLYSVYNDIFIENIVTISQKFCKTVTIGEFSLEPESVWKKSLVRKYVDKQSEFYTFSNGRGIAIDSEPVCERLSEF